MIYLFNQQQHGHQLITRDYLIPHILPPYDYWNRLTSETRHISQDSYTVSYQYDEAHRLTELIYPDGMEILYSYDDLNRMTEMKRYVDGSNDEILLDNVQYTPESLLTQFDCGNDLRASFSYDARDRPLTMDVKDGETSYLDLDFTYDSNSNITQMVNGWRDTTSNWHSQTETYTYDGLDRLVSALSPSWSHTYAYDKVGNRVAKDGVTYTINLVNEVTALSDGTTFSYDSNGSRTQKTKGSDTWVYTYDDAHRLTKVEKNGAARGEYVYDGDGRRIQATENGETTTYIYSGLNVLYEENTNGTTSHIYGPTGRLAKRTTANSETHTFYYHTDHLGSTRLVTDESGNIVTDTTYEPFGESTVNGEENYLYTGKEKDTDLYYYGARYYDPETGRFITRDLLSGRKALPQSLNLYTYCLNNPVKLIDPYGLEAGETFCEGDGENRVCITFTLKGWFAEKGSGDNVQRITDSEEIARLMNSSDAAERAKAVYLMLLVTHPEIRGDPSQAGEVLGEGYLFPVTIGEEEVDLWIIISKEPLSEKGEYATTGLFGHMRENGDYVDMLRIVVYQAAFQSIAHLYHVIGHEGVHVYEYAKFGETWEANAFKWNLNHMMEPFCYPFDPIQLLRIYQAYAGIARPSIPV